MILMRRFLTVFGPVSHHEAAAGYSCYDWAEWRRKQAEGSAFVTRIAAQPKVWIVGSEDDLNRTG